MTGASHPRLPSRIVVPDRVLYRRLGDETVLLNLDTEEYYALDGVGSRFFELVTDTAETGPAVESLLAEYDVHREVLEADLLALLSELGQAGLVEIPDVAGPAPDRS